jgi:hypothetical protein
VRQHCPDLPLPKKRRMKMSRTMVKKMTKRKMRINAVNIGVYPSLRGIECLPNMKKERFF